MAKLLLMLDGAVLRHVNLSKVQTTIGRRHANDVVIDNLGVSGEHALVRRRGNDFLLEDLGSTNGTFVNGDQVKRQVLQSGDRIAIGTYQLRFVTDVAVAGGEVDKDSSAAAPEERFDFTPPTIRMRPGAEAVAVDGPKLRLLTGTSAGHEVPLVKTVTRIGRPGVQVAVITRRPTGFFIAQIEGDESPLVNGAGIGSGAQALANKDLIEIAGVAMRFLDPRHVPAAVQAA